MSKKKLLGLYGLKWNPFSPELPTEALHLTPKIDDFCWRIEQALIREGGFALICGEPGSGREGVAPDRLVELLPVAAPGRGVHQNALHGHEGEVHGQIRGDDVLVHPHAFGHVSGQVLCP